MGCKMKVEMSNRTLIIKHNIEYLLKEKLVNKFKLAKILQELNEVGGNKNVYDLLSGVITKRQAYRYIFKYNTMTDCSRDILYLKRQINKEKPSNYKKGNSDALFIEAEKAAKFILKNQATLKVIQEYGDAMSYAKHLTGEIRRLRNDSIINKQIGANLIELQVIIPRGQFYSFLADIIPERTARRYIRIYKRPIMSQKENETSLAE
jgi:hypothetical protein